MIEDHAVPLTREPMGRWWLLWTLYGLPRCSQAVYPADFTVDACNRLIWPWQAREIRNGAPVHVGCIYEASDSDDIADSDGRLAPRGLR